jgi:UMF1 family MFS transporter
LSGWGWGLGYLGGLACLALCLVLLIRPDPPLFGLEREIAEPVRAVALLVAAWVALFSLPFFLLTPDPPAGGLAVSEAVRRGVATFVQTVRQVRAYRPIVIYLIAHMIYTDGLNTLFSVGGIYAAVTFGMDFDELLRFGIALNVTAGLGAFAFGWVDDWVGPKRTVLIALGCLLVLASAILLVTSKAWFWGLALGIGIFLGPTQAASRSLMARLAPPQMLGEMFGLYALAGKATAFLGPAVFGAVTQISGSQRVGLSTILLFLIVGMVLLLQVPEGRAAPVPAVSGGSAANR